MKVSVLLALSSASRVSDITNLRVDYLTKHSSVYTACQSDKNPNPIWSFTFSHKWQQTLSMQGNWFLSWNASCFGGLGKTNFLLAILNNKNRYLRQQSLGGWDKSLQWQVSTKKSLRRTQQYHLQSNGVFLTKSLVICQGQGHWSQASTFQRFYRKSIWEYDSNFQSGIFNKQLWREEIRVMTSRVSNKGCAGNFTKWNFGLCEGGKRPKCDLNFTSEIRANDLILPTRRI